MGSPTRVESSFESGSPYPDLTCLVGVPKLLGWRPNLLEYAGTTVSGFPLASLASGWLPWPPVGLCGRWALKSLWNLPPAPPDKSGRSFEATFEQRQVSFIIAARRGASRCRKLSKLGCSGCSSWQSSPGQLPAYCTQIVSLVPEVADGRHFLEKFFFFKRT